MSGPRSAGASPPSADVLRLAAIDVGSNSVHMVVAQADADGAVTTLWRMKEMVGLGRISFPSRKLSADAMDRAVATLERFQKAAVQRQCEKIIAVATSAIREAENGGDLIERIKAELGLVVRVVSAREEARLIYLGVRHAMPLKQPHVIVDVGGGSVEFIVGDEQRALMLESRKLGAARMTAQFVRSDPISREDQRLLVEHYDQELGPVCASILSHAPVKAIGTSGTLENLAALCRGGDDEESDRPPAAIERAGLSRLVERLEGSTADERAAMSGLDDHRRDQVVAGALLVQRLFKALKLKRMEICGSALREGILLDYLNRHLPDLAVRRDVPDPRRRSVLDLARRCDWHRTHSLQVARLCLRLFDELRPLHRLGALERDLIEFGALLHDIGWHIAQKAHHKHAMYLILNGDLTAHFSAEEVAVIANIARYHRKRTPTARHESYAALSRRARRIVDVGAALLRIADGLDRSHSSVVNDLRCRLDRGKVACRLDVRGDVELELWGARRKADWFAEVMGRPIAITA